MITLLVLLVLAIAVVLGVPSIRKKVVTRPVFGIFKKILPPLSATEREAMASCFAATPTGKNCTATARPS